MKKRVSATDAKNNFGGLLEDVTALGRVDIVRHGRLVAVVMSPGALAALEVPPHRQRRVPSTHMVPPALARAARVVHEGSDFGDGED